MVEFDTAPTGDGRSPANAARIYLATIAVPNTRATYVAALDRCGTAGFGARLGQRLVHLRVGREDGQDVRHQCDRAGFGVT